MAWYDLSSQQAAIALGCSVTALNVRLHRARKRLRKVLAPQDAFERSAMPGPALTSDLTWKASR